MKNKRNSKCWVRNWGNLFSPKFNVKYTEMIPVKFSATLIFSSRNFNFFKFSMNCPQRWKKWLSPRKNFVMGKNFRFRDFRFKIRFKTFWIDSDQKKFRPKFFDFAIFCHFWPKNHVFWGFRVKIIFFKKIFHLRFKNFISEILSYRTLLYLYPLRRGHQMS